VAAISALATAAEPATEPPSPTSPEPAAYANLGDDPAAILDYSKAIYPAALSGRARAYLRQNDAKRALADAQRLVDLDPNSSPPYALRASAEALGGDTKAAKIDFDKALSLASDPAEIDAIKQLRSSLGID
jgi:Flp pilus assembly protein TadD